MPVRRLLVVAITAASLGLPAVADEPLQALPYSPGLDLASLDRGVNACEDFYRFSCGGWQQKNPIPPDQSGWDVYSKLQDENRRFVWALLQDAAAPRDGRSLAEQQTGDYFAACMDDVAVERAGAAPLRPLLARIDALSTRRDAAVLLATLHLAGNDGALFRFGSEQDFADSSRVIGGLDAGGLGLPDRDHYLKPDRESVRIRAAYRAHIARLFTLLGEAKPAANAAARTVMAIETLLARASLTREERRSPRRIYHPMTQAQLRRLAPAFDWRGYLAASAVPADAVVNVAEPAFVRALQTHWRSRPLADWKTYLRWHLVNAQAPYLSAPFARADFDFHAGVLRGVQRMPPRWRQCVSWVDRDLGDALGQLFVERAFTPQTQQRAAAMSLAIQGALRSRIQSLDWMSGSTKRAAIAKLDTLIHKVGYPPTWRDYRGLELRRDDFHGNVERSLGFEARRQLAKIGQPVDRDEWVMTPPTVNAYYDAQLNTINFPAGILQPPLFDPSMDDAPNYGNTGATIGHELTHGFDDEGRQFDAQGNLRDWWTRKDAAEFGRRAACIAKQYSGYTVVGDVKINAALTLGEDVADLGGAVLAYEAWKSVTAGQALTVRDGFTPDQRFFVGMAQWACSNERPETLRLLAMTDNHSPNRHRVNGVVANMPAFARAFSCKPGQPMVRPRPCKVW
ncbi:endothelin-converting enzyme [Burkholderiaceae bacterium]|nr:endothelin-converting enzyme [Burkholderiaceae bacterium]